MQLCLHTCMRIRSYASKYTYMLPSMFASMHIHASTRTQPPPDVLAYMHTCHDISRCAYLPTYMDAYMQLRQHICIYAPICVCAYAYLPARTHICIQVCLRIYIPARISIYAYMPTYMHAHMQLCHRICIYAPIPACIYANMPGYKHICIYAYMAGSGRENARWNDRWKRWQSK